LMEADATLGRAGGEVVLDPVAFENRHTAVVALDRQRYRDAAARVLGPIPDCFGKIDGVGRVVELAACHLEYIGIIERGDDHLGHDGGGMLPLNRDGCKRWPSTRTRWSVLGLRAPGALAGRPRKIRSPQLKPAGDALQTAAGCTASSTG